MPPKRTLDNFFQPVSKVTRIATDEDSRLRDPSDSSPDMGPPSTHAAYPFPIADLPQTLYTALASLPASCPKELRQQPDLDALYYQPLLPAAAARFLYRHLRATLPFYRVEYAIQRGSVTTNVRTPRFTTVFGIDDSACFDAAGDPISAATHRPLPAGVYSCLPRPLPASLDALRRHIERCTGHTFNFALVNYYASGQDSISFHSDDERFLGPDPAIASLSLGAPRDFILKHKPQQSVSDSGSVPKSSSAKLASPAQTITLALASGDMVLMRGRTQAGWLHAVPKRAHVAGDGGRINITFRRALVRGGTENYYRYNVGTGPVWFWDARGGAMTLWKGPAHAKADNGVAEGRSMDERGPTDMADGHGEKGTEESVGT